MPDLPLPVEFREEVITKIIRILSKGESCSLIGVGSSGKSNVVRHLDRSDVREYHLGETAKQVLNLYINCAKLTESPYTTWGLYCLMLRVIAKAVEDSQPNLAAQQSKLRALWKEAIESESDALARSNLEDALDAVFKAGVEQAFISLDDFDEFFVGAPALVFKSLRALRDDNKGKIVYVTVTRRELGRLREPSEVEDFLELVAPATTIAAGQYSRGDARFMVERLAARETPTRVVSPAEQERMLELSGRHAGLLRMIYKVTLEQISLMSNDVLNRLRGHPAIVEECEKIWASLEEEEWRDLEALVSDYQPDGGGIRALMGKGIIQARLDGKYDFSSPVFANFVVDYLRQRLPIQLLQRQQVRVGDHVVEELDGVEYHLLSFLVNEYPKAVTWGQLLDEMYYAEAGRRREGGPPGRRLDVCLNTVRRKIELEDQKFVLQLPDGSYRLL